MKKKKIVILCVYPRGGAPSQRFRFEQQLPFLEKYFHIQQFSFWSEKTNNLLYEKGNTFQKIRGIISGLSRRFLHTFQCLNADIVFIHREIIPIGSFFFEYIIGVLMKKKIIFDFDDAIWNMDTSNENKKFEWLKSNKKIEKIIKLSSLIIVGNNYLSEYAKKNNDNVVIIPTTIETTYHLPKKKGENRALCIGWTGSKTTVKHFGTIVPVLVKLKNKYKDLVKFKLIGDGSYKNELLNLMGTPWNKETEILDLQEIDIGIMPLPDDEWAKGKCGFKGLQYMALEIPTIMSPVGVNTEIIQDGINGFLANSEGEWLEKLSSLVENKQLRTQLGKAGRKTIIEKYSVQSNKQKYLDIFDSLIETA